MIVIADDITGAAEIAGIAFERGQKVRLVCGSASVTEYPDATADETIVIATDMRSMTEAEAVEETRRIATYLSPLTTSLFKKTDSALRGHVIAELTALMQMAGYQRAVYCPANPSRGRVIRGGVYYIDKIPIDKTDFSFDPEFPATTATLKERFPDVAAKGIIMPDATNLTDLFCIVRLYDDGNTLFAGAADLFSQLLPPPSAPIVTDSAPTALDNLLILCGSTQSKPINVEIPISPMPREVYEGSNDLSTWGTEAYTQTHSLILTIPPLEEVRSEESLPGTNRANKDVAVHLRTMMAQMAKRLVDERCPDHLVIEGGATAWATLQALGWREFTIERQIAPGVVQMRAANGTLVTMKPGSYPWGNLF